MHVIAAGAFQDVVLSLSLTDTARFAGTWSRKPNIAGNRQAGEVILLFVNTEGQRKRCCSNDSLW